MITTERQTPSAYSNESRDYQLFGHLFDFIFNNAKINIDSMLNYPLSKNTDKRFLDLIVRTLGFFTKHEYSYKDLLSVASAFKEMMRIKGTIESIRIAVTVLLYAQGLDTTVYVFPNEYNTEIYIPVRLDDKTILEDILDYILPAGITYSIFSVNLSENNMNEEIQFQDTMHKTMLTTAQISTRLSITEDGGVVGSTSTFENGIIVTGLPDERTSTEEKPKVVAKIKATDYVGEQTYQREMYIKNNTSIDVSGDDFWGSYEGWVSDYCSPTGVQEIVDELNIDYHYVVDMRVRVDRENILQEINTFKEGIIIGNIKLTENGD